ncbi:HGxxPAAW family protein [Nocardioides sp.]|uniref:HGxxPAAW family protein n=1 Tax=Nocardioides sp. TaxID=35761 RepID=UPI002B27AD02|nr:HGxxPAAW family protein [Nocardioides sp.]
MSDNHGNTPAAWTAVAVGLIGFAVGGAGLMFSPISYPGFWVGVALVVVAGILFVVMDKMGFHESGH